MWLWHASATQTARSKATAVAILRRFVETPFLSTLTESSATSLYREKELNALETAAGTEIAMLTPVDVHALTDWVHSHPRT